MANEGNFVIQTDIEASRRAAERLFAETALRLRSLLPASARVRHIGSTAIPGCLTKGDLDIVIRVEQQDFAQADEILASRFRRNTGSARTASFSAFEDSDVTPCLGIQLTLIDGPHDDFHVFAEALRRDAELVARYNDLKRTFDGRPMDDYRAAKDKFIAEVLAAYAFPNAE